LINLFFAPLFVHAADIIMTSR